MSIAKRSWHARFLPLAIAGAGLLSGPACGDSLQAQGTLEASFDGEARTWYAVAGEAQDGPYASSVWVDSPDGRMLVMAGFDEENPPIDTFSRGGGPAGGEMTLGDYTGSALTVAIDLRSDPLGDYPLDGSSATQVIYAPDASRMTAESLYSMTDGLLTVEDFELTDGSAAIRGTFSGRLEPLMDGGSSVIKLANGRFDVNGIPSADAILPR